jgi:hypothetical protein
MAKGLLDYAGGLQPFITPFAPSTDDEYYAAIGKFIINYASAEVTIHQLARKLSGVTDRKARLLFAGMRIGDVTGRIYSLLSISRLGSKSQAEIHTCLEHFDAIGKERDKMVHRTVDIRSGKVGVTNMFTSRSILAYEQDMFSLSDILHMSIDCLSINICLYRMLMKRPPKGIDPVLQAARGPWRYKPPQPQNKRKANLRRIAESLARLPPASQE